MTSNTTIMDSKLYITMDPKSYATEKEMWAQKFAKDPKLSEKFIESVEAVRKVLASTILKLILYRLAQHSSVFQRTFLVPLVIK